MLRLFKSSGYLTIAFVFLYTCIIRLPAIIHYQSIPDRFLMAPEPLSQLFYKLLLWIPLDLNLTLVLSGILIIFLNAMLLNNFLVKNKVFDVSHYIPAVIFILIASCFREFMVCSPSLLSLTFIIISFSRLFESFNMDSALGNIYDSGLWIAIASLFYFPSAVFIIFGFLSLIILRPLVFKEWVLHFFGFMTPYVLCITYYLWTDEPFYIWQEMIYFHISALKLEIIMDPPIYFACSILFFLMAWAFIILPQTLLSSLIQFRKFIWLMVALLGFGMLSALLAHHIYLAHFILLSFPVSILVYNAFHHIQDRPVIAELIHFGIFAGLMIFQFIA